MDKRYESYKGIHPGIVIERELNKRGIKQRPFAMQVNEHPQTFNAIVKGKRNLNVFLALKVENALQLEEGTLVLLQAHYDINQAKNAMRTPPPDLPLLRRSLFWDTDIDHIDWHRQYKAVIQRVFERGNEAEKAAIVEFYGKANVDRALAAVMSNLFIP